MGGNVNVKTSFSSVTLPMAQGPEFMQNIVSTWTDSNTNFLASVTQNASLASLAFQSFPSLIGKQSEAAGGNAMGLSANDGPRFIVEQSYLYAGGDDADRMVWNISMTVVKQIQTRLFPYLYRQGSDTERYLPYFANDALFEQSVYQSYKEYPLFKQLQRQNDPEGFISKRAGGFKY